jgi:hypothetical protein
VSNAEFVADILPLVGGQVLAAGNRLVGAWIEDRVCGPDSEESPGMEDDGEVGLLAEETRIALCMLFVGSRPRPEPSYRSSVLSE